MTTTVKYTIEIEPSTGDKEEPWAASAYLTIEGKPDEYHLGEAGVGESPQGAILDLLIELETVFEGGDPTDPCLVNIEAQGIIAHQVSDGSCDQCGAKNFN